MASLKERAAATLTRLREKFPWLDHILRMVQHYGAVNGNAQAGAVTYFGFLSFFPILALGFFVIGLVAQLYPDIKPQMVAELNTLLPGVIGNDPGQISLKTIESYSGRVGLIGLLVLLYAGLGSVSLSGAVTGFSGLILGCLGIDDTALVPNLLLTVLGHVLAIAASTVLLLAMFKLL